MFYSVSLATLVSKAFAPIARKVHPLGEDEESSASGLQQGQGHISVARIAKVRIVHHARRAWAHVGSVSGVQSERLSHV
jgi:hypothetical protein